MAAEVDLITPVNLFSQIDVMQGRLQRNSRYRRIQE